MTGLHVNDDDVEEERLDAPNTIGEDAWSTWCDELGKVLQLWPAIPAVDLVIIQGSLQSLSHYMRRKEVVP